MKHGLKGMIGKGARSSEVREAIKEYRAVYFAAVGGAAALIAGSIKKGRGGSLSGPGAGSYQEVRGGEISRNRHQ